MAWSEQAHVNTQRVVRVGVEPPIFRFQVKPGHLPISLTGPRAADLPERQPDVARRRPARQSVGSRHWLPRATCLAARWACPDPGKHEAIPGPSASRRNQAAWRGRNRSLMPAAPVAKGRYSP